MYVYIYNYIDMCMYIYIYIYYMYLKINLYICICDITQNFNGHQKLTQSHVKLVNFDEITTYHDKREKAVRSP